MTADRSATEAVTVADPDSPGQRPDACPYDGLRLSKSYTHGPLGFCELASCAAGHIFFVQVVIPGATLDGAR